MKRYFKYNPTCIFFIECLKVFFMIIMTFFDIFDYILDIIRILFF